MSALQCKNCGDNYLKLKHLSIRLVKCIDNNNEDVFVCLDCLETLLPFSIDGTDNTVDE